MDAALVESFVRLRSTANDHLSCGVDADGEAVFKEIKPEAGGVRLGSAAQSHSSSLQHREARALQEHKAISDGDVDGIAGLPVCRLTPVHPAVGWVDVADRAAGAGAGGQGAPAGGAGSDSTLGRFPPHSPAGGVPVILAGQNDIVVPVELRLVGVHPKTKQRQAERC